MKETYEIFSLEENKMTLQDLNKRIRIAADKDDIAYYCVRESRQKGSITVTIIVPTNWPDTPDFSFPKNLNYRIIKEGDLYQLDPTQLTAPQQRKFQTLDEGVKYVIDVFKNKYYPSRNFAYLSNQKILALEGKEADTAVQNPPTEKDENVSGVSFCKQQ